MRNTAKCLLAGVVALSAAAGLVTLGVARALAQAPPAPQATQPATPQQPTFRVAVDLVTTDVIVRDSKTDSFVSDLKVDEFEVYEDGIRQEIVSLVLTHGGRVFNVQAPPPAPAQEGIILPPARPTNDAAGRVFLIFIDDLHLDFRLTPRTRDLMNRMLRNLVHDGDMFGIVSTGTSSISEQLTYDRQVLEAAVSRVTGSGLRAEDIVKGQQSSQGNAELRYRAHVAFSTAYQLMKNLESLRNRRKAVIYISSGYDFNPFETSRLKYQAELYGQSADDQSIDPFSSQRQGTQFAEADLVRELAELTRAANRANATFYTIDPRGLVAGQDIGDEQVDSAEWQNHLRETQDSLRVLAEQTGGIAVVNQNDFDKALKRIDAETSDYYVLGYYSGNPDPLKRTRRIEVKARRDGVQIWSRTSYSLRPTQPAQ
ncbi:MAG: VWFA-related Acidobacterial domain protein [Acidobacteria bacterium]|nr:VWFA-related Acidobacterial domain protein [Acidobacteriota bacterium]